MSLSLVVRGTMWVATVAWAAGEISMRRGRRAESAARLVWTTGALIAIAHAGFAFHFVHGWSHSAAALETVRQAEERIGVGWSGGIYVNYVFLVTWLADVVWWWVAPESRAARSRKLEVARSVFFVFMFANGAVIFATGVGRVIGTACVAAVAVGALLRRRST
jgi:hypothetical protein